MSRDTTQERGAEHVESRTMSLGETLRCFGWTGRFSALARISSSMISAPNEPCISSCCCTVVNGGIFGHAAAGFGHRANGGACREIVKRNQGSEIGPAAHEFFGQFAGFRVSGISALNFQDKPGVELQPHLLGKTFKPVPPLHAVDQDRGSFDGGNAAVPKVVQMLKRLPCPRCIIHDNRTSRDISYLTANDER